MPMYEFICEKCNKRFTLTVSVSDYEKKKYECPKCKSHKVRQRISTFQTITSKKS
jgi:putative FmdB family regulatory protein